MSQREAPDDTHGTEPSGHQPVLVAELLRLTNPRSGETAIDLTAGRGGHSVELARAIGPTGRIVLVDADPENLEFARHRVRSETGVEPWVIHANFAGIAARLREPPIPADLKADIVVADLGFSSSQMDDPSRGFSFAADGPLDMRLDPRGATTAADLLRTLPERELADLIFRFGEEPLSRRIARKVVALRGREPIDSTAQLARLVREAYGARARRSRLHPATRTFMALRIAVNDELGALRGLLQSIDEGAARVRADQASWIRRGARVAIIAFHSLEDRLVKRSFADMSARGLVHVLTRKPVVSSIEECASNPRARSAKLRVAMVGAPDERE